MAAKTIPSLTLCYKIYPEDPTNLQPEKISSSDIPEIIEEKTESICYRYLKNNGASFKQPFEARLSFSSENGISIVSCNDDKFKEILKRNSTLCTSLTGPNVKELGISHLKKMEEVTHEVQKQAMEHAKTQDIHFFDLHAYELWEAGIHKEVLLDVKIEAIYERIPKSGLETKYVRFPHLLENISEHFDLKKLSTKTKICIVGPGLFENDQIPTCPQFIELLSLFPRAEFLILDNNKKLLEEINSQISNLICYHPGKLKLLSQKIEKHIQTPLTSSDRQISLLYRQLFRDMSTGLVKKADKPEIAQKTLDGNNIFEPVKLKTHKEKIHLKEFDIKKDSLKENEKQFHIVVATLSVYPVLMQLLQTNGNFNSFAFLAKFLSLLKENGSLYIDASLIDDLKSLYTPEGFAIGIQFLELVLKNKLSFDEITEPEFLKKNQANTEGSPLPTFKVNSSIMVIRRTAKKYELPQEESKALFSQLTGFLNSAKQNLTQFSS